METTLRTWEPNLRRGKGHRARGPPDGTAPERSTRHSNELKRETYGICQGYRKPIARGRLEALPSATTCVRSRAAEAGQQPPVGLGAPKVVWTGRRWQ